MLPPASGPEIAPQADIADIAPQPGQFVAVHIRAPEPAPTPPRQLPAPLRLPRLLGMPFFGVLRGL